MAICTEDTWKILEDLLAENKYAITEMILELKR